MAFEKAGIWRYVKEAFNFRWNLLFLIGGTVAAALSPAPDVLLPLIGAAELTYLAGLTSLPRFQAAIDAKAYAEKKGNSGKESASADTKARLGNVLGGLGKAGRHRFQRLRERCLQMQGIAHGVSGGQEVGGAADMRNPGLDRLLWVFLRLLYSQQALLRFLEATDEDQIKRSVSELEAKRQKAEADNDERILRSLADAISTAELRLENYQRAEKNAEFVGVELDRIEGKIQALSEMAVSNQDPDYISSQVDSVADSMAQTEETIRDLHMITGLSDDMEAAPEILDMDMAEVLEG